MKTPNYTITTVEPWDSRPLHPEAARGRGLEEGDNYDHVFILTGERTSGALHSPLEFEGRYFRPFTSHRKVDKVKGSETFPFCLKAVELTKKEIEMYLENKKQNEHKIPEGSKKLAQ